MITDKPTRSTLINVREETKDYSEGLSQEVKDKLLNSTAPPKAKSFYPQTSNQEVGWDADMVICTQPQFKQTWNYTKPSCEETRYASTYITMTRKSPYSSKL
jgi:hypothetical protein